MNEYKDKSLEELRYEDYLRTARETTTVKNMLSNSFGFGFKEYPILKLGLLTLSEGKNSFISVCLLLKLLHAVSACDLIVAF